MTNIQIAELLDRAIELLSLEEVMYSLGLDYDHVDSTFVERDVTKIDKNGVHYTVTEWAPMTDESMQAQIDAHGKFVLDMCAAAKALRAGAPTVDHSGDQEMKHTEVPGDEA